MRLIALLIGILIATTSFASSIKYCIQVATGKDLQSTRYSVQKIKDYPDARIEKRDGVYLLRVGASESKSELYQILKEIKKNFPDAFIKECEIEERYVVYPQREDGAPKRVEVAGDEEIKKMLVSIRKEISSIREEIEKNKNNPKETSKPDVSFAPFEKFLYSIGLFIGSLFLFTWILIGLIYKKVAEIKEKGSEG